MLIYIYIYIIFTSTGKGTRIDELSFFPKGGASPGAAGWNCHSPLRFRQLLLSPRIWNSRSICIQSSACAHSYNAKKKAEKKTILSRTFSLDQSLIHTPSTSTVPQLLICAVMLFPFPLIHTHIYIYVYIYHNTHQLRARVLWQGLLVKGDPLTPLCHERTVGTTDHRLHNSIVTAPLGVRRSNTTFQPAYLQGDEGT